MIRILAAMMAVLIAGPVLAQTTMPQGFVHLAEVNASIRQDIRYAGARNFVGRPIAGYRAAECVLTREAAAALDRVQKSLLARGLTLVVFDCYRPASAVADFMAWSRDISDQRQRAFFYPAVDKRTLTSDGYLSARSTHSRGSTVDLAIAPANGVWPPPGGLGQAPCMAPASQRGTEGILDFGTAYDCFDPLSHVAARGIAREAQANRRLLASVMAAQGFRAYAKEWWHFQLRSEPFPTQVFDFPIPPRGMR
jgi:D-alanyl-D-alanine dipeptidase